MGKIINIICKILLTLLIVPPILGPLGVFPEPTRDMYTSDIAFNFIQILMETKYIMYINAFVFLVSAILLWSNRVALASILIFPITVNIVAFHMFLDGGLFTAGAIMGNVLLVLNLYFLWQNREAYKKLIKK